jgi:hypothetical protein
MVLKRCQFMPAAITNEWSKELGDEPHHRGQSGISSTRSS